MVLALPAISPRPLPVAPGPARCSECGAFDWALNDEGFTVCSACGLVIDDVPMVNSDALARGGGLLQSHTVRGYNVGTRVGTRAERERASVDLQRGVRLAPTDYLVGVKIRGHGAIRRILSLHGCEQQATLFAIASRLFWQFYIILPKGSLARNVDVVATAAIYRAAARARVALNVRRLVAQALPDPSHRAAFLVALKATAPLCPPQDSGQRLLLEVRNVASMSGISARTAYLAARLAQTHARYFPSIKPAIAAAAIVLVTCACDEEEAPACDIAGAAGVAQSAMMRCVHRAVQRRGKINLDTLAWPDLKGHVRHLFTDAIKHTPVPPMVGRHQVPAGAASVAGYLTGEVTAKLGALQGAAFPITPELQAASVAAGLIEHHRAESPVEVGAIISRVAASTGLPGRGIACSLIKIITSSRVFPVYIAPEELLEMLDAGILPISAFQAGEGPPPVPGT